MDVISRTEVEDDQCNLLCTTVVARRTFVGLISMVYGLDGWDGRVRE